MLPNLRKSMNDINRVDNCIADSVAKMILSEIMSSFDLTYCLTYGLIVLLFLIYVTKGSNKSELINKYNLKISIMWRFLVTLSALITVGRSQSSGRLNYLTDSLLQQFMTRLDNNQNIDDLSYGSAQVSRHHFLLEMLRFSSFVCLEPESNSCGEVTRLWDTSLQVSD